MEFRTKEEINKYLNSIGVYLRRFSGGSKLFIKTSDKPESCLEMNEQQEIRLARFIVSSTSNFNIDFFNDTFNFRVYATNLDYDIINNFNKENDRLRKIKSLYDELQNYDYLYSIRESQFFQINSKNQRGLFLIDKDLVPEDGKIIRSEKYIDYLKKAASFNGATNSFEDLYRKEMSKFKEISICEF